MHPHVGFSHCTLRNIILSVRPRKKKPCSTGEEIPKISQLVGIIFLNLFLTFCSKNYFKKAYKSWFFSCSLHWKFFHSNLCQKKWMILQFSLLLYFVPQNYLKKAYKSWFFLVCFAGNFLFKFVSEKIDDFTIFLVKKIINIWEKSCRWGR